jgi:hypothetical protein
VPRRTGRIDDIGDPQALRLHRRRLRRRNLEADGKIQALDARPPGVEIVDHHLHHEVRRPILLEGTLQDEAGARRAGAEDGDLGIEQDREAQRLLEGLAGLEIARRQERTDDLCGGFAHDPLRLLLVWCAAKGAMLRASSRIARGMPPSRT